MIASLRRTIVCLLIIGFVTTATADDKKKKPAKKKGPSPVEQAFQTVMKRWAKLDLSDEQKTKLEAAAKEHAPKIAAARKAIGLSAEQRKARTAAGEAARKAGKKGKEIQDAISAAVDLTGEQSKAAAKAKEAQQAFFKATNAILTKDQRAALGQNVGGGKKKDKK